METTKYEKVFPTGNVDVDMKILNMLNDNELYNMCSSNKYLYKLYNGDNFWIKRIMEKYPNIDINLHKKDKNNRSWKEYYFDDLARFNKKLSKTNLNKILVKSSGEGKIVSVIISIKKSSNINSSLKLALKLAKNEGHRNVIKHLTKT